MAGVIVSANYSEIALVGATAKTVLQIKAAANHPVKIKEWGVFFDGTSVTAEPVQVELMRQTTDGTFTGASNKSERTQSGVTVQTACNQNATAEPTAGDVLAPREVHPQAGYQEKFSIGDEIIVPAGGRVGIKCTAPVAVNVRPEIVFEE